MKLLSVIIMSQLNESWIVTTYASRLQPSLDHYAAGAALELLINGL